MSSQNVPFGRLYIEAALLHHRNTPRKGKFSEGLLDTAFLFFAVVTVLGSAIRFLNNLPQMAMGIPLDAPLVRIVLALMVGYASLVQSLFLFKLSAWLFRQK